MKNTHRNTRKRNRKEIIGKIYANWCGHCKALKVEWPKFKKMVESKGISHIDFVEIEESEKKRIDAFKREHGIEVSGYPTIFRMTPAKSNKPIHRVPLSHLQLGGQNNRGQNNRGQNNHRQNYHGQNNHGQNYHIEYYNGPRNAETLANWVLNQQQNQPQNQQHQQQKGGRITRNRKTNKTKTNKRKNNRTRRVAQQ
jgi:thiol-disulfide isomerase/thioredoxin